MQVELFYISVANALSIACQFVSLHYNSAPVAKLVDAPDLGSGVSRRVGSSPIRRTKYADFHHTIIYCVLKRVRFSGYGYLLNKSIAVFLCSKCYNVHTQQVEEYVDVKEPSSSAFEFGTKNIGANISLTFYF